VTNTLTLDDIEEDLFKPIVKDVADLEPDSWTDQRGVPLSEARKQKFIEDGIRYLEAHPDEYSVQYSSGDTMIQVQRHSGFYSVNEFSPQRYVLIHRDDSNDPCSCDLATLNSTGCLCGGS
jgi:hypothetical protein